MPNGADVTILISQAWAWFIAGCVAIVTIVNAWKAVRDVRNASPGTRVNAKLAEHDERLKEIEDRLQRGDDRFERVDESNEITQEALLALMNHAINGNDIDALRQTRDKLQQYLIRR